MSPKQSCENTVPMVMVKIVSLRIALYTVIIVHIIIVEIDNNYRAVDCCCRDVNYPRPKLVFLLL